MHSFTVPTSIVGAGRQPLAPIHNRSSNILHIDVADDLKGLLDLQVADVIETPVATSPVLVPVLRRVRTINRLEGLSILERRNAHLAREDFIITFPLADRVQDSSLKRVRTINKQEGLTVLERRRARFTGELATSVAQASSLKRVRTINKLAGMVRLEKRKRRKAYIGNVNADNMDVPEDGEIAYAMWMKLKEARLARQNSVATQSKASLARSSIVGKLEGLVTVGRRVARFAKDLVDGRPQGCIFEYVRTINKLAGLEKSERRKAQVIVKQSVRTYFDPEYPNHLLTPPPLARKANIEDPDISEDAKIAFALWLKKRVEAAENTLTGL